jgi:hypothetical protein
VKTLLIAAVLAVPAAALAQGPAAPREDAGFRERLYERYCEKLRESPQAYVQFVRRLKPVHGFTYTDFAPAQPGDAVLANCRVSPERVAAVHRSLAPHQR